MLCTDIELMNSTVVLLRCCERNEWLQIRTTSPSCTVTHGYLFVHAQLARSSLFEILDFFSCLNFAHSPLTCLSLVVGIDLACRRWNWSGMSLLELVWICPAGGFLLDSFFVLLQSSLQVLTSCFSTGYWAILFRNVWIGTPCVYDMEWCDVDRLSRRE